jgi:hypothetical protein
VQLKRRRNCPVAPGAPNHPTYNRSRVRW